MNSRKRKDSIDNVEVIKIIDITKRKINLWGIISTIAAILSLCFIIWQEFKTVEISGKVISLTYSQNATYTFMNKDMKESTITGQQYILKLAFTCVNKNFNYKDVNIFAYYNNEKVVGQIYWAESNNLSFHLSDSCVENRTIKIPPEEFITYNSVLNTEKLNIFYISFIVPGKSGPKMYDKLEVEFITPNGKSKIVKLEDINPKQYFYDDSIVYE